MMRRMTGGCAVVLVAMIWGAPAGAQSHDEHEVRAAVEQIFDGMRAANADLVREVLAPGVRFAGVGDDGAVSVQSLDGWLGAIGTSEGRWDEQIYDVEVQVDGTWRRCGRRSPSTWTEPSATAASTPSS